MNLGTYLSTHGLTQRAFAERIGVSPNTVARYVSGRRTPSKREMRRIFNETGGAVTPNEFFGVSPTPAPAREGVGA